MGEGKRPSGVYGRKRSQPLGFTVLVFSSDRELVRQCEELAPAALRVFGASSLAELEVELSAHDVICGRVVDTGLAMATLESLAGAAASRTLGLESMAVLRSTSQRALWTASRFRASSPILPREPDAMVEAKLQDYLRKGLDVRLEGAASLVQLAREYELEGATWETFEAHVLRQVPAPELPGFLGLSQSATSRRMQAVRERFGLGDRTEVTLPLASLPKTTASAAVMAELEAAAAEARGRDARSGGRRAASS